MSITGEKSQVVTLAAPTLTIPLHTDESGIIRVSGTRVALETIMGGYLRGDTPETIHENFSTVPVSDIYAVIAYYLSHQDEIDTYLHENEAESQRIRLEVEAAYPPETKAWLAHVRELIEKKRIESST